MLKKIAAAFFLVSLAACGFSPLHSNKATNDFEHIKIAVSDETKAPSKLSTLLKYQLEDSLNPLGINGNHLYSLNIKLVKVNTAYETQSNTVNLRSRVTLTANFILTRLSDMRVILKDNAISIDSFEETSSPYATLISDEETANKMAQGLAQEIKLRVASKLKTTSSSQTYQQDD